MSEDDYYYVDPGDDQAADPEEAEEGPRYAWKVVSVIIIVLILLLNLILVGIIVFKRTFGNDLINKGRLNAFRLQSDCIQGSFQLYYVSVLWT